MTISLPWLSTLFFVTIRLGTVLLFTPIQAIRQLPVPARLILIFVFSLLIVNYIPAETETDSTRLMLGCLMECSNGLILSTSIYAAFAVFQIAGQLIDNATGMNSLAVFNPVEHSQEPLTSHVLSLLAVFLFFGLDGHLWLFRGVTYSFFIIPAGSVMLFSGLTPIIKQFGFMFSMAFMIACPMVLILLAIDLCGGIITRNMPQMNVYFLSLPVKIILGFVFLALTLDYLNPLANKVFERCFHVWQELMS